MEIRFTDKGKPLPVLVMLLFTALCVTSVWLIISAGLPQGLLFLLPGLVLYAVFFQPAWVVYSQLGIWIATVVWSDFRLSPDFPRSFLDHSGAALAVAVILIVLYQAFIRYRKSNQEISSKFRLLSDSVPAFEVWQRPDGSLEYISPACEKISGYSAAEFLQDRTLLSQIILPEDRNKIKLNVSSETPPHEIQKEEVRILHKTGQVRWIEYSSHAAYDKEGRYIGQCISMNDIGSRKKEVENLKVQFERLHSALETSEDGIWELNLADGETYFNPRYATLMGLKPGENHILLKDYMELIHPDDLPGMLEAFRSHLTRQTTSYETQYRLLTRFGKWRWVLDRGRIMTQDASGKPTRMVGTHIDITERMMIQEALQQSEEKFRQLAENMREVFWLRDKDSGRFIYISPAFTEIWGHTAEEMYGDANLFLESIHWEDFDRVYNALRELVTNGKEFSEEYRILRTDGSVRWVLSRAYPILDSTGKYYRLAGVAEDITTRMEIDSALRASEKRYRDLIERQGDGVSIIDVQQNILYMNPAGEDIFGVARGSMMNRTLHDFMDQDQFDMMLDQIDIHQQGTESSFEIRINRADDGQRSLLFTTTPRFDVTGQFQGVIAIFKDITLRKEQENKLRYFGLHDSLTGLYNRAYFDVEVERFEASESFPIGAIMIDTDNLKMVNDQLGHAAGDDLLIRISKLLRNSVRSGDIVARIGGDEFAILMPNSDEKSLYHVLNRIDANIASENEHGGLPYLLSVSAGGSTAIIQGTLRENIDKADAHMYKIKNSKKK